MKLLQLNIWAGMIYKPLLKFLKENKNIDIFCFQEISNGEDLPEHVKNANPEMLSALKKILPEYDYYFSPFQKNEMGIGMFVSKKINVERLDETFVFRWHDAMEGKDIKTLGRSAQLVEFTKNKIKYSIINFHGLWNGQGKWDTQDRILQSEKLKRFINTAKGKVILAGDFNLLPETKSLKILEKGMVNLVSKFNIQDTRGELYKKELRFADYILVSSDVKVLDFKVLSETVSDHLPLYLEFC